MTQIKHPIPRGAQVRYRRKRCCGRPGMTEASGTIKGHMEFEGTYMYRIFGYDQLVKQQDILPPNK